MCLNMCLLPASCLCRLCTMFASFLLIACREPVAKVVADSESFVMTAVWRVNLVAEESRELC